ncbi:winged helix-turn-helix domain-containing protein [Streptococcus cameli]
MIYCVEDDDDIRELMLYTLRNTGFEAKGFADAEGFWQVVFDAPVELIILDVVLPGEDGVSLLTRLREDSRTSSIPIIMATAKGTEYDKVKGLDLGADDYLVKPFGMMEMISRIKAVLRRARSNDEKNKVRFGDLTLEPQSHIVRNREEKVLLTLKEFELLSLLMLNPNRVFTRQELLDRVWGEQFFGETRTVDVHIGTLRTKIGDCGSYIKTVRGVGYRMEDNRD